MNFHNEICWTSPTIKAKPRRVGTPRRLNDPQTYWSFQLRSQRQRMFRLLFLVHHGPNYGAYMCICTELIHAWWTEEQEKTTISNLPFETQSRQTQSNQAADLDMSKSSSVSRQYSRSSGKAGVMSSLPQWSRNFDAEKGLRMARPPKSCWALQRQKPMWTYDAETTLVNKIDDARKHCINVILYSIYSIYASFVDDVLTLPFRTKTTCGWPCLRPSCVEVPGGVLRGANLLSTAFGEFPVGGLSFHQPTDQQLLGLTADGIAWGNKHKHMKGR